MRTRAFSMRNWIIKHYYINSMLQTFIRAKQKVSNWNSLKHRGFTLDYTRILSQTRCTYRQSAEKIQVIPAGLWHHVEWRLDTDESEKRIPCIFPFIYITPTNALLKNINTIYCFQFEPTYFSHTLTIFRAHILVIRVHLKMCSSPYNC